MFFILWQLYVTDIYWRKKTSKIAIPAFCNINRLKWYVLMAIRYCTTRSVFDVIVTSDSSEAYFYDEYRKKEISPSMRERERERERESTKHVVSTKHIFLETRTFTWFSLPVPLTLTLILTEPGFNYNQRWKVSVQLRKKQVGSPWH